MSFYFFSSFPFSFYGMGFCSVPFFFCGSVHLPLAKLISRLSSPLQCFVPVLCWWNTFSSFSTVLLHPSISVTGFFSPGSTSVVELFSWTSTIGEGSLGQMCYFCSSVAIWKNKKWNILHRSLFIFLQLAYLLCYKIVRFLEIHWSLVCFSLASPIACFFSSSMIPGNPPPGIFPSLSTIFPSSPSFSSCVSVKCGMYCRADVSAWQCPLGGWLLLSLFVFTFF